MEPPIDLLSQEEEGPRPRASKRRKAAPEVVDLCVEDDDVPSSADHGWKPPRRGSAAEAAAAAAERRAAAGGLRSGSPRHRQQQQQQQQRPHVPQQQQQQRPYVPQQQQQRHGLRRQRQCSPLEDDDFALAKRLQEEEDRRAAAAVEAENRLQRRFRELEAAEAAAEVQHAAEEERGWGRGFLGGWFGGAGRSRGSAAGAAAAAAAAAGGGAPRAGGRGPRQQRSRRSPAAEAEYATVMQGQLLGPPLGLYGAGYGGRSPARGRGGFLGEALQQMLGGLDRGLPADLLLSGRDFTDADYEALLALDAGNRKNLAPREAVARLETVRVPPPARRDGSGAAAAAAAAAGGGSGSPAPELEACAICLEDARPGDQFRVLSCKHAFHKACIDRWLTQERNACPICTRPAV